MLSLLVGGFFGDEGKGKVASYLALKDDIELAVRTGAVNAGHTVSFNGRDWKIRTIPSAFLNKRTELALAPGSLTRLDVLSKELQELEISDRLYIDFHTGIITEKEVEEEQKDEYLMKTIGSTGQGVGYGECKRILRKLRLARDYDQLEKFLSDVPTKTLDIIESGGKVLVEGTQGHLLSLYHGDYPFVTSRNTTASGVVSELGIGPRYVNHVIVVFKSFITRVGQGMLKNELNPEEAEKLGLVERGTVTGRLRRVAPFDPQIAREVVRVNGATQVAITKLDAIFKQDAGKRKFSDLSLEARKWIEEMESIIGVPVTLVGTGKDSMDMVDMRREKGL